MNVESFTGERASLGDTPYPVLQLHLNRYYFASNFCKNKVVLDAACGEGYGSYIIAKNAKNVVGLDISKQSILSARERYGKARNIDFVLGDVRYLPFKDEVFDIYIF